MTRHASDCRCADCIDRENRAAAGPKCKHCHGPSQGNVCSDHACKFLEPSAGEAAARHTESGRTADELWAETGKLRAELADARRPLVPMNAVQQDTVTLRERIAELASQHGSMRAAARVMECNAGYLSRLCSGEKVDPGPTLLRRMGLREIVRYERIATPPAEKQAAPSGEDKTS